MSAKVIQGNFYDPLAFLCQQCKQESIFDLAILNYMWDSFQNVNCVHCKKEQYIKITEIVIRSIDDESFNKSDNVIALKGEM
jgi:hypothetical protein